MPVYPGALRVADNPGVGGHPNLVNECNRDFSPIAHPCGRSVACRCLPMLEFPVMLRIATVVLLLGAIANPQVSRLELSAVADGDTLFYHGTVGKFEIRLTLMRGGGDSVSGSYQYATQNTELYLQSHPLPNGKLKIVESSAPNVPTGEFVFESLLGLDQLDGTWRSADGKRSYPVHLEKIFEEQYDELPKIWSARPKSAAAKVPPEPPGSVLHTRQQIETPISLRGPNGVTLLASIHANENGAIVHIWRPIDDGFQLSYETNSNSGTSEASYDVEAFRLSGEYFVHLMLLDSGTGYFHVDTFLWIAPDVTLQRVRFVEPAKAYRASAKGKVSGKERSTSFATMTPCLGLASGERATQTAIPRAVKSKAITSSPEANSTILKQNDGRRIFRLCPPTSPVLRRSTSR